MFTVFWKTNNARIVKLGGLFTASLWRTVTLWNVRNALSEYRCKLFRHNLLDLPRRIGSFEWNYISVVLSSTRLWSCRRKFWSSGRSLSSRRTLAFRRSTFPRHSYPKDSQIVRDEAIISHRQPPVMFIHKITITAIESCQCFSSICFLSIQVKKVNLKFT